jgi:hypothetical protein
LERFRSEYWRYVLISIWREVSHLLLSSPSEFIHNSIVLVLILIYFYDWLWRCCWLNGHPH